MSEQATVTKEQFYAYLDIQQSGRTNMFDVERVISLSHYRLDRETCLDIMKNYATYKEQFGKPLAIWEVSDRVTEAFRELRKRNYLARRNFACCTTCAMSELSDIADEKAKTGKPYKGIVFWHNQEEQRFRRTGRVFLGHAPAWDDAEEWQRKAIGDEIAEVMKAKGLIVTWDGNPDKKIEVSGQ